MFPIAITPLEMFLQSRYRVKRKGELSTTESGVRGFEEVPYNFSSLKEFTGELKTVG
jgi:hypothetical protein